MHNKYQVKIEESILPELFTFDQLINEGLLDEVDDKIKIRLKGQTIWLTAREYPFANYENNQTLHSEVPDSYQECSTYSYKRRFQNDESIESSVSHHHPIHHEYPLIINKWNWGAFCLSWIWGIFNGLYWPLLIIAFNFIPYIGLFISLYVCSILGKRGNLLAWEVARRKGCTVEMFSDLQRKWNYAGLFFALLLFVFIGVFLLFYFV